MKMINFIGYFFAVVVAGAIVWSLNKVVSISNATIASNTAALSVLNDPAYGGPYT